MMRPYLENIRHNGTASPQPNRGEAFNVFRIKWPLLRYPAQRHISAVLCAAVPDAASLCRNAFSLSGTHESPYSLGFVGFVPLCRIKTDKRPSQFWIRNHHE
jgi:hypothetical protein